MIILWRREKLKVSFDYLEDGWFSTGDELQQCRQRLIHIIDARLQSADVLPFVVQLSQEFVDEHAKVSYSLHWQVSASSICTFWVGGKKVRLLCAQVAHQVCGAHLHICQPACVELSAEGLTVKIRI